MSIRTKEVASLYKADDELAQNDHDTDLALVTLYKSLGGGWQVSDDSTVLSGKLP